MRSAPEEPDGRSADLIAAEAAGKLSDRGALVG
jgi:hypothetical protein